MNRRAMTLVEMLVATAATLILMAAVAQAFAVFGSAITGSRGVLDLDARMRSVAWRLRSDLAGITVRPVPPITPESAQGYLEIIEGPASDVEDITGTVLAANAFVGPTDVDDILLFTTQSANPPFTGRAPGTGQSFESTVAEVAWFARPTPGTANPPTYTLYRKQLLVMGYVGVPPFSGGDTNSVDWATAGSSWSALYNSPCDVSVRREGNTLVPNTLADLSRREARFLHNLSGVAVFPYFFLGGNSHQAVVTGNPTQLPAALAGLTFDPVLNVDDDSDSTADEAGERAPRQGEDVVLTDVVAFDVRVFDPGALVTQEVVSPGPPLVLKPTPLVPGDDNTVYTGGASSGSGAYVDLGHGFSGNSLLPSGMTPHYAGVGQPVGSSSDTLERTYDTWTLAYEANGRDDDNQYGIDQAFDGEDNAIGGVANNLIDDPAEFETRPPYPYPLRGIEVRIRCYEPSSRQVRQVTVRHTFVPH